MKTMAATDKLNNTDSEAPSVMMWSGPVAAAVAAAAAVLEAAAAVLEATEVDTELAEPLFVFVFVPAFVFEPVFVLEEEPDKVLVPLTVEPVFVFVLVLVLVFVLAFVLEEPVEEPADVPGASTPGVVEPRVPHFTLEKETLADFCSLSTSVGTPVDVAQVPRATPGVEAEPEAGSRLSNHNMLAA